MRPFVFSVLSVSASSVAIAERPSCSPGNDLPRQLLDVCFLRAGSFAGRNGGHVLVAQLVNRTVEPFSFRIVHAGYRLAGISSRGGLFWRAVLPACPKKKTLKNGLQRSLQEPLNRALRPSARLVRKIPRPAGEQVRQWAVSSDTLLAPLEAKPLGMLYPGNTLNSQNRGSRTTFVPEARPQILVPARASRHYIVSISPRSANEWAHDGPLPQSSGHTGAALRRSASPRTYARAIQPSSSTSEARR